MNNNNENVDVRSESTVIDVQDYNLAIINVAFLKDLF